jgi:spoIIIJ-associated protein
VSNPRFIGRTEDEALWKASEALQLLPADMIYEVERPDDDHVEVVIVNVPAGGESEAELGEDRIIAQVLDLGTTKPASRIEAIPIEQAGPTRREPVPRLPEGVAPGTDRVEVARQVTVAVLERMGESLEVRAAKDGKAVQVTVVAPDDHEEQAAGSCAGDVRCLEALQYVVRRIVGRAFPDERGLVFVSFEGAKQRREQDLEQMAVRLADRVVQKRQTIQIEGINPADRRIVHLRLADRSDVKTRSEGGGAFRQLLIEPAANRS